MDEVLKISIVTVSYQAKETIIAALDSVESQDYQAIEHIVIDGNSTDGTLDLLQQSQVAAWYSEPDKGIYDAMNKGIHKASGDIIGFLNADDMLFDNQVIKRVAEAFSDPRVDAVYGDLVYVQRNATQKIKRIWRSSPYQKGAFSLGWSPPHPTFYVRKSVYEKLGGFNLNYRMGNDIELMMRFIEKHQINTVYLPKTLVKMRLGGVSNQNFSNILLQNRCVLQAHQDLGLSISPLQFASHKFADRLKQYLRAKLKMTAI